MLTRVRRSFSGCTGPPEAVPSLLIIPLSPHVYPVLCTGATRCATTVSRPICTATSRPTSAAARDVLHMGYVAEFVTTTHHRFIHSSSINSLVTGIWRDVTDTVCQAPCHTRPAMPLHVAAPSPLISVFLTPCAPLGLSSPTSYSGF